MGRREGAIYVTKLLISRNKSKVTIPTSELFSSLKSRNFSKHLTYSSTFPPVAPTSFSSDTSLLHPRPINSISVDF